MKDKPYTCKCCSKKFNSGNKNPNFCSWQCRTEVAYTYTKIDFQEAVRLYELGKSQKGVAEALNTTQTVICDLFKKNKYKCRGKGGKRSESSVPNKNKGSRLKENVTYWALHSRVEVKRGRPMSCECCGTSDPKRKYDWACMGDYYDINDYKRMCRSCHFKHDKVIENLPRYGNKRKSLINVPMRAVK